MTPADEIASTKTDPHHPFGSLVARPPGRCEWVDLGCDHRDGLGQDVGSAHLELTTSDDSLALLQRRMFLAPDGGTVAEQAELPLDHKQYRRGGDGQLTTDGLRIIDVAETA